MKLRVLTAAVLAALVSHPVWAASEGGDTWSTVEPVQPTAPSLLQSAPSMDPESSVPPCACGGSEGGDTWSDVPKPPVTDSTYLPVVATTASLASLQRDRASVDVQSIYGTPIDEGSVNRIIRLGGESPWIDVGYGESVRFIAQDRDGPERSFAWRFDVSPEITNVELSKVAPADFPQYDVRVFVSPDPLYAGG